MRIFRVAISAARIDESRRFYGQVLALDADDTVPSRLYFHTDDVILALIDRRGEVRDGFHPTQEEIYFATRELDTVYERAVGAGARISSPIENQSWGERSFYCLDPDGNRLCFVDETTLFLGHGADWS